MLLIMLRTQCDVMPSLVYVAVPEQRPDGEHVPVGRVGDPARTVEHASDSLLVPITRGHLPVHEEVHATVDGLAVLALACHEAAKVEYHGPNFLF